MHSLSEFIPIQPSCIISIFYRVWERLAQETNPTIFIASVDCGASAEADICRSSDVTTYPTLRYYLNRTEYDYRGSLSLDALHDFISSTLAVRCNPMLDVATCSEKARKYTTKWLSMETAKVRQEIERLELLMDRAESSATAELRRWMRERSDILKIILQHQTGQAKKESVQYDTSCKTI